MASRETTNLIGAKSVGDPSTAFTEFTKSVKVNFADEAVGLGASYDIATLPKGLVVDRVTLVQTELCDTDVAPTIAIGPKNDGSVMYLAATQLGATALATASTAVTSAFLGSADAICMVVGAVSDQTSVTKGAFEVIVHGYSATVAGAEDDTASGKETYRETLQTTENVSGGDMPLEGADPFEPMPES